MQPTDREGENRVHFTDKEDGKKVEIWGVQVYGGEFWEYGIEDGGGWKLVKDIHMRSYKILKGNIGENDWDESEPREVFDSLS